MAKKQEAKKGGLADKLAGLKDKWKEAESNPIGDFTNWEDGQYNVKLVGASVGESQNGRLQVKWEFENLEDSEAQHHFMFDGMDTEVSEQCLAYLRKHIEQMGFEPPANLSKLEELLEQMVEAGPELRIQLKTKGEYQNTYIKNLIES